MSRTPAIGLIVLAAAAGVTFAQGASDPPSWAYGYLTPPAAGESAPPCPAGALPLDCAYPGAPVAEDGVKHALPGTDRRFTRNEAYFDYGPGDWYPGDHPAMPPIVANGRQASKLRACALCHYPNGQGKMENGGIAGLPAAYILQQLADFKSGARRSADPRKANTNEMAAIAAALTDAEAKAAAEYFAAMPWRPWVRVVEAAEAPRVRATTNGLFLPVAGAPKDPLGQRIIEMPVEPERTELSRDPRSGFVAYVPVGSIAKGQALATATSGGAVACSACHGPALTGTATVPGIAGRSPSYLMRALYDMKRGTRQSRLMAPIVAKLTVDDMLNLTAYAASRTP